MRRKQKPPGYENWTWEEIKLGHRLSKAEKRMRRISKHLGGNEDKKGNVLPPEGESSFLYYFVFLILLIMSLAALMIHALR